ncbi:hypothetical protein L1049_014907 [Liquidambar formosana]|uniref:Lipoxygenase domain-containing protein n=1 Tax=Liquidambar formosana TaxID=63359 RepID=A0AAP0WZB9_LIQFO
MSSRQLHLNFLLAYLPSQTPPGLKDLRWEDLLSIRGNGKGERKPYDRIYDYAPYNDLGNLDKDSDLARLVLAVLHFNHLPVAFTGIRIDPCSESRIEKPHPVYIPRDETFEEITATLSSSDISFKCFSDIDKLYSDGVLLKDEEHNDEAENMFLSKIMKQVLSVGEKLLKYEIPTIIKRDRFAWLRDNEFSRQALVGVNPVNIEILKEFPILSKLDHAVYGPPELAITKELIEQELNGMSVEEVFIPICL